MPEGVCTWVTDQGTELRNTETRVQEGVDYRLQAGGLMAKGRKWEESVFRAE